MKFYLETTDYKDKIVNGVYLLNDSKTKMYAYVAPGQAAVKTFKNSIRIDTRGRKFKAVANTYNYAIPGEEAENPRWEVAGSKGDTYIVEKTENGLTCTCSGFKFRGDCKHVKSVV
jgi:SWIM zinc finger